MTTNTEAFDQDAEESLHMTLSAVCGQAFGVESGEAAKFAAKLIEAMRGPFGGEYIGRFYLAKRLTVRERSARDAAVRRDFNGRNMAEVCKAHDISKATCYRILMRQAHA